MTTAMATTADDKAVEMAPVTQTPSVNPKTAVMHDHGDAALDFLEHHEAVAYTADEEKRVIRKIDRVLMPLVCFLISVTHSLSAS